MKSLRSSGQFIYHIFVLSLLSQTISGQSGIGTLIKDGVIFDKKKNQIYFLNENHQVDAINAKTGAIVWRSSNSATPVALIDKKLLSAREDSSKNNKVVFTMLDARNKGKGLTNDSLFLPFQSEIGFEPQPVKLNFSRPQMVNGDVFITYNYANLHPLQGIHKKPDTSVAVSNFDQWQSGVIKIPKNSSKPQLMLASAKENISQDRSVSLSPAEQITGVSGSQFFSSDMNNVLVSQLSEHDTGFNNYIWQIYDKVGKKIGQTTDYRSFAPFIVNGSVLIYEVGPYTKREGTTVQEIPLELIAIDLRSGKLLWSKQIFDKTNRKSTPP